MSGPLERARKRVITFQVCVDKQIPVALQVKGMGCGQQIRTWLDSERKGWKVAVYRFVSAVDGQERTGTLYA